MAKNENVVNLNKKVKACKSLEELEAVARGLPSEVHKQLHKDIVAKSRELKDKG